MIFIFMIIIEGVDLNREWECSYQNYFENIQ